MPAAGSPRHRALWRAVVGTAVPVCPRATSVSPGQRSSVEALQCSKGRSWRCSQQQGEEGREASGCGFRLVAAVRWSHLPSPSTVLLPWVAGLGWAVPQLCPVPRWGTRVCLTLLVLLQAPVPTADKANEGSSLAMCWKPAGARRAAEPSGCHSSSPGPGGSWRQGNPAGSEETWD